MSHDRSIPRSIFTIVTLASLVVSLIVVSAARAVAENESIQARNSQVQAPSDFIALVRMRSEARDAVTEPVRRAALRQQRAQEQAAMLEFTMTSPQSLDMRGIQPNLYTGKFFEPSLETKRQCIVKRESEGQYDVRGGGGNNYFGAYQMSDALADGATWMMLEEHKTLLGVEPAKALMAELRDLPVNQWPRYWQDAAFSTVHNWEYPSSGASHWAGGRWHC